MYLVNGVAQNGTMKYISQPKIHIQIVISKHVQKLKQKSQSNILATSESFILSQQSLSFVLISVTFKYKITKAANKATIII